MTKLLTTRVLEALRLMGATSAGRSIPLPELQQAVVVQGFRTRNPSFQKSLLWACKALAPQGVKSGVGVSAYSGEQRVGFWVE